MPADTDLISLSESLLALAHKLHGNLHDVASAGTVDQARELLRWLRNLEGIESDTETWLDRGTAQEQAAKLRDIHKLLLIYAAQLKTALTKNPALAQDFHIVDANQAAGSIAISSADHAIFSLPDADPAIAKLEAAIALLPESAELRSGQSIGRLLGLIGAGIEFLSGGTIDERTYAERMAETSQRLSGAARQTKSIDTLAPPAREESVELAREILRRLKNMKFGDESLKSLIDTGTKEDKAAFAEKAEEMVEHYRNLLAEASKKNPAFFQDQRIQEANLAARCFAHAVKLMAAKEMPGSVAAAQQISADAALDPQEWKNLQDHTVGRLVKSMEGGIERAANELDAQTQEQDQAEEQAREAATESALQHSDHSRRRKRRRKQRGGGSAVKEAKRAREEYVTHLHEKQTAFMGLRPEDLAAVKALGGRLSEIGNQAKDLPPMTNISTSDKLTPDDKGFAQRKKDEREQKKPGGDSLKL